MTYYEAVELLVNKGGRARRASWAADHWIDATGTERLGRWTMRTPLTVHDTELADDWLHIEEPAAQS